MTTLFSTNFKNRTLVSLLTAVANTGQLFFGALYTGAMPASGDSVVTGTLLHSALNAAYGYPLVHEAAWSASSNGAATLSAPKNPVNITVEGVPGYLAVLDASNASVMLYADVGVTGSGAGAILSSLASTSIGVIAPALTNFTVSWPEARGTVKLNTALRNKLCDIWCQTPANIGMSNAGTIKIYSDSPPSSADAEATGTLLATFATSTSTWSAAVGGAAALAATLVASARATGTAGYARFSNSAGTYVIQGSVGVSGGGADFTLDSLSLTSGSNTSITNATIAL